MFALREPQTVKPMVPVISLLRERNPEADIAVYLDPTTDDPSAGKPLDDAGISYRKITRRDPKNGSILLEPPNLKTKKPLEIELESRFRTFVAWADRLQGSVAHVIDDFKPDVLVNAGPAGNLVFGLVLACGERGIPAIYLQHGLLEMDYHPLVSILSDRALLWGDRFRDFLIGRGAPPERLAVTGNPVHDRLVAAVREKAKKADTVKKTVLLISSSYNEDQTAAPFPLDSLESKNRWLGEVVESVMALPEVSLVIKNHPAETAPELAFQRDLIRPYADRIKSTVDGDLIELITACDLIVMTQSSVIVKALVAGRPVVSYYSDSDEKCRYWIRLNTEKYRSNIAVGPAKLRDSLAALLQSGDDLAGEDRDRLVRELAYKADGRAAFRVCREIEKSAGGINSQSINDEEN
jgi:hypothetical protein